DVERVHGRLRLRSRQKLCQRFLLRTVAVLETEARCALDEIQRAVRGRSSSVHLIVDLQSRTAADLGCVAQVRVRGRWCAVLDAADEKCDRLVEELDRLEEFVGEAQLMSLRSGEHAVLAKRVGDDELDGALRADKTRDQLRSAPSGDDPEEDLGTREVPD